MNPSEIENKQAALLEKMLPFRPLEEIFKRGKDSQKIQPFANQWIQLRYLATEKRRPLRITYNSTGESSYITFCIGLHRSLREYFTYYYYGKRCAHHLLYCCVLVCEVPQEVLHTSCCGRAKGRLTISMALVTKTSRQAGQKCFSRTK